MKQVVRYDENGKVFHSCITTGPVALVVNEYGVIAISMPHRYWHMVKGGHIEITAI